MTERQLRRIINEEINSILKEGIGDIKRAERAANKNFVDPLIAKKNARAEQVAESKIGELWENLDHNVYEYVRMYRYEAIASELNKIAEPINRAIKKYGLTEDIMSELEVALNLGEPTPKSSGTLDLYSLVSYSGTFNVLRDIINEEEGTSLVSIGSSYGLYFFEHPFDETYGDSISQLVEWQITDAEMDNYVDTFSGGMKFKSLSPEDKVLTVDSLTAVLSEEIGEFIEDAANALKARKQALIKLAKMYK